MSGFVIAIVMIAAGIGFIIAALVLRARRVRPIEQIDPAVLDTVPLPPATPTQGSLPLEDVMTPESEIASKLKEDVKKG